MPTLLRVMGVQRFKKRQMSQEFIYQKLCFFRFTGHYIVIMLEKRTYQAYINPLHSQFKTSFPSRELLNSFELSDLANPQEQLFKRVNLSI